jgi:hypothetical protein
MAIVGLALYFLTAALFSCFLLLRRRKLKRLFLLGYACAALFLLFFSSLFVIRVIEDETNEAAIVLSEKVEIRSAPDETATDLFSLHEGVKVNIQDSSLDWVEVKLEDGKVGWLEARHVERI